MTNPGLQFVDVQSSQWSGTWEFRALLSGASGKQMPDNAGDRRDASSIPGLGRSPGGELAACSSILAWRIPWTEEPAAAAAAKSLQLCPTVHDPMDCSLPGSSVHGIFQARVLKWVDLAFSDRGAWWATIHRVTKHQTWLKWLVPTDTRPWGQGCQKILIVGHQEVSWIEEFGHRSPVICCKPG